MATPPSAGMDRTDGSDLSSAGTEGSGSGSGVTDEAAQAAMAAADGMDAPEMPAGEPLNPEAEVVFCEEFGTIKSIESDTPLTVTFVNLSDGYRGLVWIGTDGTLVDKGGLNQSESVTVETFKDSAWMLTDGPGNCIEMFAPKSGGNTMFEIKEPSPIFGDEED